MLDVLSERGQQTVRDEELMTGLIRDKYPRIQYVRTPKDKDAAVDAMLVRDGEVIGIAETKCRYDMTRDKLFKAFKGEWLISLDKILKGAYLAKEMRVPFYGLLFLVDEKKVLSIEIADASGDLVPAMRLQRTVTQKTCNGGSVERVNAYVDMTKAKDLV